jgi:biopolymer transport protein ExbD
MHKHRHSTRMLIQNQLPYDWLARFGIVYLLVILITLIIAAVVGSNWDLKYPHIKTPGRYSNYQLGKFLNPSNAYSDKTALLIAADRSGNIYVDNKTITLDELSNIVTRYMTNGSGKVYLKVDEACQWDLVMKLILMCTDSGAEKVSLLVAGRPYGSL